jgi:hypothetical protein
VVARVGAGRARRVDGLIWSAVRQHRFVVRGRRLLRKRCLRTAVQRSSRCTVTPRDW